jgi:hypothetical protein
MQFWSVNVAPKYLNFATFSKAYIRIIRRALKGRGAKKGNQIKSYKIMTGSELIYGTRRDPESDTDSLDEFFSIVAVILSCIGRGVKM